MDGISPQTVTIWLGLLNLLVLTLGGFLVYLFRSTQKNATDLMDYKLEVAKNYAHKDEIENLSARIDALGDRMESRMDRFEDKFFSNRKEYSHD